MQHQDLTQKKLLKTELDNLIDEGCPDAALLEVIKKAVHRKMNIEESTQLWARIDIANENLVKDNKESSEIQKIIDSRKAFLAKQLPVLDMEEIFNKIYGAWLVRCVGCTLGKPVEGWPREKIRRYLQAAGAYPLKTYIPSMDNFPPGLELWENYKETTLGNINRMVRDDDIDYTVLGLKTLETYGLNFSPLVY